MLGTEHRGPPRAPAQPFPAPHMPMPHTLRTLSPCRRRGGDVPRLSHHKAASRGQPSPNCPQPWRGHAACVAPGPPAAVPREAKRQARCESSARCTPARQPCSPWRLSRGLSDSPCHIAEPKTLQLPVPAGQARGMQAPGTPLPQGAGAGTRAWVPRNACGHCSHCPGQLCRAGPGQGAAAPPCRRQRAARTHQEILCPSHGAAGRKRCWTKQWQAQPASPPDPAPALPRPCSSTGPTVQAQPAPQRGHSQPHSAGTVQPCSAPARGIPAAPLVLPSPAPRSPSCPGGCGRAVLEAAHSSPARSGLAPRQAPGTTVVGDPPSRNVPTPAGPRWGSPGQPPRADPA